MTKEEMRYIIGDYCSQYEIEITEEELDEAAEEVLGEFELWEEYNYRCGIHSTDPDLIIFSYFDNR